MVHLVEEEVRSVFPSASVLHEHKQKKRRDPERLLHKAEKTYTCPVFSFDVTNVGGGWMQ